MEPFLDPIILNIMENKQSNCFRHDELDSLVQFDVPSDLTVIEDFECVSFRREIREILRALRATHPGIYAVLYDSAPRDFHISLDEDILDPTRTDELSIAGFCARYASFGPKDCLFSLNFQTYVTESERASLYAEASIQDCSPDGLRLYTVGSADPARAVEEIVEVFPDYLLHLCRQSLLSNRLLRFDGYALSSAARQALEREAARCRATLVGELRRRYEMLAGLSCLREYR